MAVAIRTAEQRRESRHSVAIAASIRHYRDRLEVQLHDLSRGGAMASTDSPPDRGEEVVLSCGDLQVVATIAWVKERNFGLRFHRDVERRALVGLGVAI